MQYIRLDANKMGSKEQLHDYLTHMLFLPSYYGRNLDALYDCLSDIHQPTILFLTHQHVLNENLDKYGDKLLQVLMDAAQKNSNLKLVIRS